MPPLLAATLLPARVLALALLTAGRAAAQVDAAPQGAPVSWNPLPVSDDPLVRMPGSQPGDVTLLTPNNCTGCHANYSPPVEPVFQWRGSMMAQASRDFLFWTCFTVAGQDSIWAFGRPNAMDLCLRCHLPRGWLEGRSDPTNATLMTGHDFDGVQCEVCHQAFNPMFDADFFGQREGTDWLHYWDETGLGPYPSQQAALDTYVVDAVTAIQVRLYNGNKFFKSLRPVSPGYTENGTGQMFVSPEEARRGPFADIGAYHPFYYSRYHKSRYFCGTCHDVSNPMLLNLPFDGTPPGDGVTLLPSEQVPASSYFHVERTFSEFLLSDYGLQGGAAGLGPFAPDRFPTSLANNFIARCQDCHLPDVAGKACNREGAIQRPDLSVEHPNSGLPQHDLTGANMWVPAILASTVPGSPNHDPVNEALLLQGPAVLTLDMTQGLPLDPAALLDAVERARANLERAAALEGLHYDRATGTLTFRVQNQTGHKLITGYPEGRRMFVNVRAYRGAELVHEVNPYDAAARTLRGLPGSPYSPPLGPAEAHEDALVYEVHSASSLTGEAQTFHFILSTSRIKDNRIPPQGFRVAEAPARLSEPVWNGVPDLSYFTPEEYAGGYDDVTLAIAPHADRVEVRLYYQTTSREYIEFLRAEIEGTGTTLPASAYIIQTDPFFARLRAWGTTLYQLWEHNADLPGAAPVLMTSATWQVRKVPAQGWTR